MITLNTGAKLANNADGIIADAVDISGGYFVTESIDTTTTGESGKIPDYACVEGALCYCKTDGKFYRCVKIGETQELKPIWAWKPLGIEHVYQPGESSCP